MGAAALLIVTIWLVASFAFQLDRFQSTLGRLDRLKLLPSWSFFAPRPASRDDHVMVRYVGASGGVGAWQTISLFPPRSLRDLVWNPAKRRRKILRDAGKSVRQIGLGGASTAVLQCSMPYLLLLHHAVHAGAAPPDAIAIQFAVIETSGRENRRLWIRFISSLHRL